MNEPYYEPYYKRADFKTRVSMTCRTCHKTIIVDYSRPDHGLPSDHILQIEDCLDNDYLRCKTQADIDIEHD